MFWAFCFDAKTIPHLLGLGEGEWTPIIEIVFKIFTTRRIKNCKTKKPLHTSGNRNKRGRKFLSAPVFCFKPKICNGFESNQSKRKKEKKRKGFSLLSVPLTERGRDL